MDTLPSAADEQLWYPIYRLLVTYWRDVDHNGGRNAHARYVADGSFIVGDNHFDGQDGVRTFYAWRRGRETSATRHLLSDLIVFAEGDRRAKAVGLVTLHRASGRPPFRTTVPSMLSDFTCSCVRGEDDQWRFQSHVLTPLFVGDDVPLSLSVNTNHLARFNPDADRGADAIKPPRIG
jgi:hypothetical protein